MTTRMLHGDVLARLADLPDAAVHCVVTSPPYFGLRNYGVDGQIGLEASPDAYIERLVEVFREVRRVLRPDGTLWLNLGDCYAGSPAAGWRPGNPHKNKGNSNRNGVGAVAGLKPKDLMMIPARVALALQADGWHLRSEIIWHKTNPMPESCTDRPTSAHEKIFLLAQSGRYFYDAAAIAEPAKRAGERNNKTPQNPAYAMHRVVQVGGTRNRRNVWTVPSQPYSGAHFATFPPALIEPCILAGCPKHTCANCGTVLDLYLKTRDRSGTNGYHVQSVSEGVQPPAVGGKAQPLLQPEMQIRSDAGGEAGTRLSLVRSAGYAGPEGARQKFLRQILRREVDSKEPQHHQGTLHHVEGVHSDLSTGPPKRQQGRLRDGTPSGDGADSRQVPAAERSGASSRRGSAKQLGCEPRTSVEVEARQVAESADGIDRMPALRDDHPVVPTCPRCGATLDRIGAITPGVVLDCFAGVGTTGLVADRLGRDAVLIEINPDYVRIGDLRIRGDAGLFAEVAYT